MGQQLSRMEHLSMVILLLRMEQALMLTDPRGTYQRLSCIEFMYDIKDECECKNDVSSPCVSFCNSSFSLAYCFEGMICLRMFRE